MTSRSTTSSSASAPSRSRAHSAHPQPRKEWVARNRAARVSMPPVHRRADRVAEAIRENVATFLTSGAKDPRLVAHVTVTAVDVTQDLRHAKIFISMLGSDTERAATL